MKTLVVPTHLLQGTRIKLSFQTSVESVMSDKTASEAFVTKLSFTKGSIFIALLLVFSLEQPTLKSLSSCQTFLFLFFF